MAKEKLIVDDEQSNEKQSLIVDSEGSTRGEILNSNKDLSDRELQELKVNFARKVAENGLMIFEIVAYALRDKESKVRKSGLKAYKLNEVQVEGFNLNGKLRGFVSINNGQLDIPLLNTKRNDSGPWYIYDKDEAIRKAVSLNKIEADLIEKEWEEYTAAHEFMQDIIKNERF